MIADKINQKMASNFVMNGFIKADREAKGVGKTK